MSIGPVIFKPIFKPKIWGGRKLQSLYGKDLPGEEPIGESWEVCDLEDDQSIVARGPGVGKTLRELMEDWGSSLFGDAPLFEGRFPLLIKFLDANETLSVQVHPDEAMSKRLGGRVRIKNEAWYILHAEEHGCIYRGVKDGVDADAFRKGIEAGNVDTLMNQIPVKAGQCYYLPSGTVHALGAGVVVAEVQTPSDITYRVFDWNRVDDKTSKPRELHVEQAMECIEWTAGPTHGEKVEHSASVWTAVTSLVQSRDFVIERVRMVEGMDQPIPHDDMVVWMVLEGKGSIVYEGDGAVEFAAGDTLVIPAGTHHPRVRTASDCMWLEVTVPIPSSLAEFERPSQESLRNMLRSEGYVQVSPPGSLS